MAYKAQFLLVANISPNQISKDTVNLNSYNKSDRTLKKGLFFFLFPVFVQKTPQQSLLQSNGKGSNFTVREWELVIGWIFTETEELSNQRLTY